MSYSFRSVVPMAKKKIHRNLDHGYGYNSAAQVKKFHCPLFYHLLSAVAFQLESKEEDNSLFVLKD